MNLTPNWPVDINPYITEDTNVEENTVTEPEIVYAGFDAPLPEPTVDDLLDRKIAAQVAPVVAKVDEFISEFDVEEIADSLEIERKVSDAVEYHMAYEMDFESLVSDALSEQLPYGEVLTDQNFDPSDYDLVTDEAFSSFREEIENALAKVSPSEEEDKLTCDQVNEIFERLDAIEQAIRNFGGAL